jgi:hypothetical protein
MDLLRSMGFASSMLGAGVLALGLAAPAFAQTADPAAAAAQSPGPSQGQPQAQPEHPPEKRIALVIANGQYRTQRAVPSAGISARRVAEALRNAGFEVEEASDLDRAGLEAAVRQFGARLGNAAVGAFYYAGRSGSGQGLCMEPVDAPARAENDFAFECVPVGAMTRQLERNAQIGLVFWDAEMPARGGMAAAGNRTRAMLASGMAMAFAGQPGEAVANAEASEQVSPFADALANALGGQGSELLDMLRQVRRDVRTATSNAQTPWFRYGLDEELVLVPRPVQQAAAEDPNARQAAFSLSWQTRTPPPDPAALELAAWNAVITMRSDNARRAGLMDFLQRFPSGQYASLARINLDDLDRPAAPAASAPPDPLTLELAEWTTVQSITAGAQKRAALQGYLQHYPSGRFAPLARLQLAEMNEPVPPPPAAAPAAPTQPGQAQQAAAAAAVAAGQRYIAVRQVPMRSEPNAEGRMVRTLQPYTVVTLRGPYTAAAWVEIQAGTDRGFVIGNALRNIRDAEEEEWARVKDSRDRAVFETFLRRFPGGAFANEAARRRDQLARAPE